MFLLMAIFYGNMEYAARMFLYCFSAVSMFVGIAYPIITLLLIRRYPKHKKVTAIFIKEFVLREYDDSYEKGIYKE